MIKSHFPDSIKKIIRKLLFGTEEVAVHYSQSGEDLNIIAMTSTMLGVKNGFFIDVGSFHPHIGSNTFILYKEGWNGINIDPRPGSKALFDKHRPRDINVELGIGEKEGTLNYYFISETSSMNSFSKETLELNGVLDKVTKIIERPIWPLSKVIENYLPEGKEIDLLSIDAEGFEMEILTSFDILKWRPKIIALEQNNIVTFKDVLNSDTCKFLESKNYQPVAKNVIVKNVSTVIYVNNQFC